MKSYISTLAIYALVNNVSAHKMEQKPDVFGPNGKDFSNEDAKMEYAHIGIDIEDKGEKDAKKCMPGQWATVHWTGRLMDGRVVTDSRSEIGGLPKTFNLGANQVFSCWDFAIQKLNKGTKATIHCPSFYAYGTAYTQSPLGGEPIPLASDVDFDLEVLDCNIHPTFTEHVQPVTTTMQPDQCFYLHNVGSEHTSHDLVLSTEADKKSDIWPGKYAIVEHRVYDTKEQQWTYDEKTGSIHNLADPSFFLDFDYGWAFIADLTKKDTTSKHFPTEKRKWYFDPVKQELQTVLD
jgi:FKBP-type peptidyl-prolyl cis-trans isomerase